MVSAGSNYGVAGESFSFLLQIYRGRWFMAFACFMILSSSGATYIFGTYSKDIKSSLGYDQQTLNTLSFFKDLGTNVGILAGLINEFSPPYVVLSIGAATNLFAFFMIYLAITGQSRPAAWQMCVYVFLGANSQTFANNGAIVTCLKNFPESRGIVLGLLKGFLGLSGAIFTQLYLAFYHDSKSLVLLIAWLPSAVSVVFLPTVRIVNKKIKKINTEPFYWFLYICLLLVFYIMVMIIAERRITFSSSAYRASGVVVIFLLLLPIGVVVKEELRIWKQREDYLTEPLVSPPRIITTDPPRVTTGGVFAAPERGEDYSILQAIVSLDMILLVLAVVCGLAGTQTTIDNMGQIGESLGYPSRSVDTFVSLISIWNCLGRLGAGFASEILLVRYRFSRPLGLSIVLLVPCLGHLLIAFGVPGSLYFASIVIGFCFGAAAPLIYAIISDIFGLKYFSTLNNLGNIGCPVATYFLNVRVTGYLYDQEAARQNYGDKASTCVGTQCFKIAFLVITASALVGTGLSLILVWRTWTFYRGDIYAKIKADTEGAEEEDETVTF